MNQKLCLTLLLALVLLVAAWSRLTPVPAVAATPTPIVVATPSPMPTADNNGDCSQKYTPIAGVISGTLGRLGFEDVYCVTKDFDIVHKLCA